MGFFSGEYRIDMVGVCDETQFALKLSYKCLNRSIMDSDFLEMYFYSGIERMSWKTEAAKNS